MSKPPNESQAGFLKSSAKVTLHPKEVKRPSFASCQITGHSPSRSSNASPIHRGASPYPIPGANISRPSKATWVCVICSFSNLVPQSFDPATANTNTPLPPCQACGIKPTFPHVLKAAIAAASGTERLSSSQPSALKSLLEVQHNSPPISNYSEPAASSNSPPMNTRFQCPAAPFSITPPCSLASSVVPLSVRRIPAPCPL